MGSLESLATTLLSGTSGNRLGLTNIGLRERILSIFGMPLGRGIFSEVS